MEKNTDIQFLKDLQKQMRYESEHDNDSQASPRFWVVMDYRVVPTHEEYGMERTMYYYNDGDHLEFDTIEDLKEYLTNHYVRWDKGNEYSELDEIIEDENTDFDTLWEYVIDNLNDDGFFDSVPVKEESFIVPDTMFLTKEEAKRHLEINHYHYTSKAHTYAMTAWRAPKVERLLNILQTFDLDSISVSEEEKA